MLALGSSLVGMGTVLKMNTGPTPSLWSLRADRSTQPPMVRRYGVKCPAWAVGRRMHQALGVQSGTRQGLSLTIAGMQLTVETCSHVSMHRREKMGCSDRMTREGLPAAQPPAEPSPCTRDPMGELCTLSHSPGTPAQASGWDSECPVPVAVLLVSSY